MDKPREDVDIGYGKLACASTDEILPTSEAGIQDTVKALGFVEVAVDSVGTTKQVRDQLLWLVEARTSSPAHTC